MIKYKVVKKPILSKPNEYKYYAVASNNVKISLKQIVKETLQECEKENIKLKPTEANLLFDKFFEITCNHLENGEAVKLGDIGTFSLSVKSEGQEKEDQVLPNTINKEKCKVSFRNGTKLKIITQNLSFEKDSN